LPIKESFLVVPNNSLILIQFRYGLVKDFGTNKKLVSQILQEEKEMEFSICIKTITGQDFYSNILKSG